MSLFNSAEKLIMLPLQEFHKLADKVSNGKLNLEGSDGHCLSFYGLATPPFLLPPSA